MRPAATLLTALLLAANASAGISGYPYQRCFEIASNMHDVPLDLVLAVAATESNWDPDARSHANAHGIMQIQWPGTARYLGVRRVAELYNPCLNIELGSRYLKELLGRFDGDETKALAAYNYGPGRIERAAAIPNGALRYAATVRKHRANIVAGSVPDKLQANDRSTLVVFRSKLRAERIAARLSEALQGATVTPTQVADGYAVQLAVGQGGLTLGDRVTLKSLGFTP